MAGAASDHLHKVVQSSIEGIRVQLLGLRLDALVGCPVTGTLPKDEGSVFAGICREDEAECSQMETAEAGS